MNVTRIPTNQFGWAGVNCLTPAPATSGRCTYPDPLMIAVGAQGISTESLIAWATAPYQVESPQPPKAGVPHFHVAGNGALYQFVELTDAPWAIDNAPFSPTAPVVILEGTANPNLYGIFITYESGADKDAERIAYPNSVQLKALADLIRSLQDDYLGIPYITYRQIHTAYEGSSESDTRLLNAIALLIAQPVPPLCNAEICVLDAPPSNALLMTYNPLTRCANGLVDIEAIIGTTGFNVTDGTTTSDVPTDGSGLLSFTDTSSINFVSSGTPNGADVRATVIISPNANNRLSLAGNGLYVAPDNGSALDWCLVPAPAPAAFSVDDQAVLVYDSNTGCIRRVPPQSVVSEGMTWCGFVEEPEGVNLTGNRLPLVFDYDDNCIKSVTVAAFFNNTGITLLDGGSGNESVAIRPPNNTISFIGGNGIAVTVDPTRTVNMSVSLSIDPQNILTIDGSGNLLAIPPAFSVDWCDVSAPVSEAYSASDHTLVAWDSVSECIVRVPAAGVIGTAGFAIGDGTNTQNVGVLPSTNTILYAASDPLTVLVGATRQVTYGLQISTDVGNLISLGGDGGLYATLDWCNIPSLFNIAEPVDLNNQQFLSYDNVSGCVVASSGVAVQEAILTEALFTVTDGSSPFDVAASSYTSAPANQVTFAAGAGLSVSIDQLNHIVTYDLSEAAMEGLVTQQDATRMLAEKEDKPHDHNDQYPSLADFQATSADVLELNAEIASLNGQLTNARSEIAQLSSQLITAQNLYNTAQGNMTAQLSDLQAQLTALSQQMAQKADKSDTYTKAQVDLKFGIGTGGKVLMFDPTKTGLTAPITGGGVRVVVLGTLIIDANLKFMIESSYNALKAMGAIV